MEQKIKVKCPDCNNEFVVAADLPDATFQEPKVRSNIKPINNILVYRITSEQMKKFITQKAKLYCPDVKIAIEPRYCEKKKSDKTSGPRHSYASLRIAISEHALERGEDNGWYGKIGESPDNIRFIPSIFQNLINLYKFDPKVVDQWLDSYKKLEDLEDSFGMTEAYINDIRKFSTPQCVKSDSEKWIIFAAAAEKVIQDMLTDYTTNKINGRIQIVDICEINKEFVQFIVYLYPNEVEMEENPNVRKILLGKDEK